MRNHSDMKSMKMIMRMETGGRLLYPHSCSKHPIFASSAVILSLKYKASRAPSSRRSDGTAFKILTLTNWRKLQRKISKSFVSNIAWYVSDGKVQNDSRFQRILLCR